MKTTGKYDRRVVSVGLSDVTTTGWVEIESPGRVDYMWVELGCNYFFYFILFHSGLDHSY